MAKSGGHSAVVELRDLALSIIGILDNLTLIDPSQPAIPEAIRPGVIAAHEVAKRSNRWPSALHAVKEIRDETLEKWTALEVGSALEIRINGKKRGFDYDSQTGFALDIFHELEAIRAEYAGIDAHLLTEWAEDYADTCDRPSDDKRKSRKRGAPCKDCTCKAWRFRFAASSPLSKASLSAWADAGRFLCLEWCNGDWGNYTAAR